MLVMNSSKKEVKKGPPKFPPSVQLAIDNLNVVLQTVVKDSVCDLVYMLRHEGHCQQIVADAIKQAEKEMAEEDKEGVLRAAATCSALWHWWIILCAAVFSLHNRRSASSSSVCVLCRFRLGQEECTSVRQVSE